MAYVPTTATARALAITGPVDRKPGLLRRFYDAFMLSRQRQAEREIARYLSSHKFTDEIEREIERRFLSMPPRW